VALSARALALEARLFAAWEQARADPAGRQRLIPQMQPIRQEFRTLLEAAQRHDVAKVAGLCRQLLKLWPALWAFVATAICTAAQHGQTIPSLLRAASPVQPPAQAA